MKTCLFTSQVKVNKVGKLGSEKNVTYFGSEKKISEMKNEDGRSKFL